MKTLLTLTLAAALAGCASPDYAQYAKSAEASSVARSQALAEIAKSGDSSAKVAAVMALALGQGSGAQNTIQAPQASQALQWASILVPGLTQVAGMRYNYLSQQTQSNNATAFGISTNSTFAGIAGRIQAPGAVTTTTTTTTDRNDTVTTLSGTGTLGSGAYSTTDRNDVTSPIAQIVPTVIQPTVLQPTVLQPTVIQPVFEPTVQQPVTDPTTAP